MDLFTLVASLTLDTSKYDQALGDAKGTADSEGSKIGSVFKKVGTAIAGAFAVEKVVDFTKSVVSAYGEYEQLVGGIDTLFKSSSDTVQKYAEQAFMRQQISANDYMNLATSFSASLISSLGGDTAKAAEVADMAITDMSDNANRMGTSMDLIQNAYQGFAKQNYTINLMSVA